MTGIEIPYPAAQFEVAVGPLLINGELPDASARRFPTQFVDVEVRHPLNEGRTAKLILPMDDAVVAGLEPWEHSLRIWYYMPGAEDSECVFWGQTNVEDDFAAGTVTLTAQDGSVRHQHHYLRIGDDALDDPADDQKGSIHPDDRGLLTLNDAALVPPGSDYPEVGLGVVLGSTNRDQLIGVERGQEVWAQMTDIAESAIGPDFDCYPQQGSSTSSGMYGTLHPYDHLGRDLTETVIFEFGYALDNLSGCVVTPGHPTTHAHVVDNKRRWRVTAAVPAAAERVGMWVDWVQADHEVKGGDVDVLTELAKIRVRAYSLPPKFTTVELRPDPAQAFYYGNPDSGLDTVGDFYVGDRVTVRAQRGARSFEGPFRITEVVLRARGARGPVATELTLVPVEGDPEIVTDIDET